MDSAPSPDRIVEFFTGLTIDLEEVAMVTRPGGPDRVYSVVLRSGVTVEIQDLHRFNATGGYADHMAHADFTRRWLGWRAARSTKE